MAWSLAHNLDSRSNSCKAEYPGITVYSIGDQSHQAEASDHNPDARGIVHAIDVMTYSDIGRGNEVRDWALSWPNDLEYVIFNRHIYERYYDFRARDYYGSDPHTDHVHISGKHGSTGYSSATGTGYDTAAEQMTPPGFGAEGIDDVGLTADEHKMLTDISWAIAQGAQNPDADPSVLTGQRFIYWTSWINSNFEAIFAGVNRVLEHLQLPRAERPPHLPFPLHDRDEDEDCADEQGEDVLPPA